jgi:hypothetical protein
MLAGAVARRVAQKDTSNRTHSALGLNRLALESPCPSPEPVPDGTDPVPLLPKEPTATAALDEDPAKRVREVAVRWLQQRILDHYANGGTAQTWDHDLAVLDMRAWFALPGAATSAAVECARVRAQERREGD